MHLVTVDRPGVGGSDLQPGRRLAGWPLDVVDLADALDFDRFAVVGYSAGGPYALACAALIGVARWSQTPIAVKGSAAQLWNS